MATATKETGGSKSRATVGRARSEPDIERYSGRVAARVRTLRDARKWTVEQLAAKIGVADQTMYGYESGKRDIPPDLFPAIAAAFGLSVRGFLPAE